MGVRGRFWRFGRAVAREIRAHDVSLMAASIAYHAFISLLPLLVLLVFALSVVDSATLTATLVELTDSVLTPRAQAVLAESLTDDEARTRVSILGGATLVWGLFKIFRGLNVTFADLYGTDVEESVVVQIREGLVVVFALAVAVGVVTAASVALTLFPDLPYGRAFSPLFVVAGLAVAFFPIYYVFPDVDLSVREVVPGVLLAAVAWALLQSAFQSYVVYSARFEAYGALGSALLVVVWLYFSSLVLLLGAVVNVVLAGRTDDRPASPAASAARADRERAGRERVDRERAELARAYDELARAHEELDAENRRLRERVESLDEENERLKRENARLARRLRGRRWPVWTRAKRWLFGR
ncbi:YihY family inner membrane protein [Halorussus salilacus]|uniref:YhjD/YihY/BrkB family envelope integrity protein n=1 Tax=Halorussus salilacus TaxID=2953750 RepID=UPI00209EA6D5|nr:YhjD/YihY/BrkB family envelope integrity protein [Halorussus salilacus]USZ69592.1 YihY family inner membrane protein [Halorussus salilacus]